MLENLRVIQQCPLISAIKNVKKAQSIWKRVEKLLKIKFNSKLVYGDGDKYIKTKIKIYGGSLNTKFLGQKNASRKSTV